MRGEGKGSSRSAVKGSRFLQKKTEIWQTEAFDTLYAWSSDSPTNLHCRSVLFHAWFALPKTREGEG